MTCAKCNRENPADAQFCQGCGVKLELACVACGTVNGSDANFCKRCGARLTPDVLPAAASAVVEKAGGPAPLPQTAVQLDAPAPPDLPEGERKTLTALFADIAGSTALMEDLDPEHARAIIDPALRLMIDAVHRYEGYVVQSTGDGIFALFGAPIAHEDHPQRALYAALQMRDALREYGAKLAAGQGRTIQVRIGVNTGEVVMRQLETTGHTEYTPIGHTANLAARIQTVAPAGSIAVSEQTRRLVAGYFEVRALGAAVVKGVSEAVEVYEVTAAGALRTHFELAARRGLTKFVGREEQLAALGRALEQARASNGQVVAAVGEAGAGKSRLIYEFKLAAQGEFKLLEAYSVSHGKAAAWIPVVDLLKSYFEITEEDNEQQRSLKARAVLDALDPALEDTLPYLESLLGIGEAAASLEHMDASVKRRRTLEALKRLLIHESLRQPLVLVFEDLHWVDEETQELLNLLADSIGTSRVLMLVNYRPEYRHQWSGKSYYTQLQLGPLSPKGSREMLSALLGEDAGLEPLKQLISDKTAGNPFFIEEIVQALLEQGALVRNGTVRLMRQLAEIKIPPTVQGVLASRIDRLPAGQKDLLQTLAVLGHEFPLGLVRGLTGRSDAELGPPLAQLRVADFIYQQDALADVEYIFKHALTQEVAYNSMLFERRKVLHERAGAAIEALYAERIDDHLNDLAHHYSRSANSPKAVEYLHRAGAAAAARSAYTDAVRHLSAGLDRLHDLDDPQKRLRSELDLRLAMLQAVQPLKGAAAAEVGELLTRARELAESVGDNWKLFNVLFGLRIFHARNRPKDALECAREMLAVAERTRDPAMAVAANYAVGASLLNLGEFTEALAHFECAMAVPAEALHDMPRFWTDPRALSRALAGLTLWYLGYPDQAVARSRAAIALARELGRPSTTILAIGNDTGLRHFLRDVQGVLEGVDAGMKLAEQIGFLGPTLALADWRGWAMAELGEINDSILKMQRSADPRLVTTSVGIQNLLLAQAYGKVGRADEGLELLDRSLLEVAGNGARIYEGLTHCVAGELKLLCNPADPAEAERHFRTAIEIARAQRAKSWELRATMSLARLLDKQGRRAEAREMLAEIYAWFTEGFDTADLKDAKTLLDQLSGCLPSDRTVT